MSKTKSKEKNPIKKSSLSLSKQIRDLQRLLQKQKVHATLPPEVIESKQKQLNELLQKKQEKIRQHRIKKYKKKYKYVRFVEEQKARRAIRKVQRKIQEYITNKQSTTNPTTTTTTTTTTNNNNNNNNNNKNNSNKNEVSNEIDRSFSDNDPELEKLQKQLKKYEEDLLYILHFPWHVKYISLYPKVPMTNQRILRLQQSIREDLIKKRDMGLISLTKPPKSETESTEESSVSQREKRPKRKKHQNPVKLKSEERNQESNGSKKMLGEFVVPTGSETQHVVVSSKERDDFFISTDSEDQKLNESSESESQSQSISSVSNTKKRSSVSRMKRKWRDDAKESEAEHSQKKPKP